MKEVLHGQVEQDTTEVMHNRDGGHGLTLLSDWC